MNRDISSRNGRYLNVKPVIGLLTSTARTFINEGVTTEFATQILGTTLDNGRVYAQLLTKSSLVLYDQPSDESKRTRLPFEADSANKWNIDESLGDRIRDQYIIKNTDYVSPKDGIDFYTIVASKPSRESTSTVWTPIPDIDVQIEEDMRVPLDKSKQNENDVSKLSDLDSLNLLDSFPVARERKISSFNNVNLNLENKPKPNPGALKNGIEPAKVNPNIKLPTFTVKNEFSPIFYYIDNVESKTERSGSVPNLKNAKKLFGHKDDQKPLRTFTYYGFANFTTIVGDTVIIFSPSTAANQFVREQEEITPSAKAEIQPNVATKLRTYLSSDLNMITKTMPGHQLSMETALPTIVMNPQDNIRASKALYNNQAKKPSKDEQQDVKTDEKFNKVIESLKNGIFNRHHPQFILNKDSIQPSESAYSTINRNHATEKIKSQDGTTNRPFNPKATEPLKISKSSNIITFRDRSRDYTTTEPTTTEPSEVTTESSDEYEESTVSNNEESEEQEENFSEDATCTNGIIPVPTMTTAYKTFTYLTTYFIPLEGTETTTSIKSHEVVTSETGYTTNLRCKTEEPIDISPTSTQTLSIEPSKSHSDDSTTESTPTTTDKAEEDTDDYLESTTTDSPVSTTEDTSEPTTMEEDSSETTTTEHAVTTSGSHTEMSVTEKTTVSLDTRGNFETTTESKDKDETTTESDETEIDLIFKTLYTTYTYFTTYFQGSTSTVASRKSVVTNVITSTLDLNSIDPSIFNAIESSDYLFKATQREELGDISPTSVGIGRPTQTMELNSILDLVQYRQVIDSAGNDAITSSRIPTPEIEDEKLFDEIKSDVVKTFYTTYTFFTTLYLDQDVNICSRSEIYTNFVGPASLIPTKTNDVGPLKTKSNEFDFNKCKKVTGEKRTTAKTESDDIDTDESTPKPKYNVYTSIDRSKNKPKQNDDIIDLKKDESMQVTDIRSSSSKGERQVIENAPLEDQISSESNIDEIIPSPTLLLQTSFTTFTYFTTMYVGKDSSKIKSHLETVTNVVTETLDPKTAESDESNLPITYYTTFTYWTTLYKDKTTTITSREDIISNVIVPTATVKPITVNPIETNPIEVATIQVSPSSVSGTTSDTDEIKPSSTSDDLLSDDGKATFFTTYTYFTTYYVGNTSELRSSLETITNIVDNTKELVNENQLARAVGKDAAPGNLLGDNEKPIIKSTAVPDAIIPTVVVGDTIMLSTQLAGTENIFVPGAVDSDEKKIISSQVAIISGDSTVITGSNDTNIGVEPLATTKAISDISAGSTITTTNPSIIEGSVTEPSTSDDETDEEDEEDEEEEDEDGNTRKKSRLTFSTRKRTFTPVIRPFASRNRPTFSPKRVSLTSGATTITRSDFTPTITATPALKSSKSTGFGANRGRQSSSIYPGASSSGGRRFNRVSTGVSQTPSSTSQRPTGFSRGRATSLSIQPSSTRRGGFRTSSIRANAADISSRASSSRIRPSLSSRFRGGTRQTTTPQNSEDTLATVTENPSGNDETESTSQSQDVTNDAGSRRTTNSLLRFRRPPFTRAPLTTTPRTITQGTTRRGSFNRNRGSITTTTSRPTTRTTVNPLFALRNRQRPNSLFPPRGLINKQPEPAPEEEVNDNQEVDGDENEEEVEGEELNEDSDYESSDKQESQVSTPTTTAAPRRIGNTPIIKPFGFKRRSKRQTGDYGTRRYSNFRRPTARTPKIEVDYEYEVETTTAARARTQSRYLARNNNYQSVTTKPTARPSSVPKTTSNGRTPFILRGETKTTSAPTQKPSFRTRSSSRPTSRSSTTANLRPKAPRLKTYSNTQSDTTRTNGRTTARTRNVNRNRTPSRFRTTSNDIVDNNYVNHQSLNDGKLTVTHKIPMEVTIPVVNGKLTEYKNVLTAKPSTEILQPHQYSTTQNAFGSQYIVLVSESSEPAENGATRVIQFILRETPTTSVIFTPTTIRGRRTSFSHIIPSTVYDVERVTSTVQPQINANVPLANILLSQLLLGNIAMPQPQINPLLAFQGQPGVAATPTTEYKTRTTTYVTTVTDVKSTVLPITFRGKEILTTIVDSSADVITATEFITDTVVVTPTGVLPTQNPNQLNSILLLLQQQQQLQQAQPLQTASPLIGLQNELNQNQNLFSNDLLNSPKPEILDVKDTKDYLNDFEDDDVVTQAPKKTFVRRKPNKPAPPRESSVITLYVSGRYPGEFSTVLSTVYADETQSVQKREAIYYKEYDLSPSMLPDLSQILSSSQSEDMIDSFVSSGLENSISENLIPQSETQSLESIIGEVSKYITMKSQSNINNMEPTVRYVVQESGSQQP